MADALTFFGSKAEDTASAAGDLLSPIGAIYKAVPANLVGGDGDYCNLQTNDLGQLRVEAGGVPATIVSFSPSALTALTQVAGSTVEVSRSSNISLQVTSFTSGKLCVKVSNDGTVWLPVSVVCNCSGQTLGGGADGLFVQAGRVYTVPGVYRYVSLWAGDTALTATISLMIDYTPTSIMPFSGALQLDARDAYIATGANNVFLPSDGSGFFDVSGFGAICVEWTATLTTATVQFQFSNNPAVAATWAGAPWQRQGATTTAPTVTVTGASPVADKYYIPVLGRYFRVTTIIGTAVSASYRVFALRYYPKSFALPSQAVSGSLTTVSTVTTCNGQQAHDASATGNVMLVGGASSTGASGASPVSAANDATRFTCDTQGALVVTPFGTQSQHWQYTGSITNSTTAVVARADQATQYVLGFDYSHDALSGTTELQILGGTTVIYSVLLQTAANEGRFIQFPHGLRSTAEINVKTVTAVTGKVAINLQGIVAQI